ncbi:F0F1 ATP synthase subunit A [Rasiella rasia]|uniref:ATP synthase subunit a n=1 Tax=Rasiella rasia TaxID=2744027 RepID=A0A6G6GNF4_9FLAO|nr:F0F1 ATP synthase subunit A [Rasiella rasia]QIE59943.1 F0F1 ATP synthase subunit A [Rasiella rasia]
MQRKTLGKLLLLLAITLGTFSCTDKMENTEEAKAERKREVSEYVKHHNLDTHDFTLYSYTGDDGKDHSIGFSLPVILWSDGLHVFASGAFHHGEEVVESNGKYFALDTHTYKIYETDASGAINYEADGHHVSNAKPLDFSITKSVFMIMIVSLIMFFLFRGLAKSYVKNGSIASGPGRFFEPIVLYIRDDIAIPNIGEKSYRKYMPFLLTVFFFIWFLNLFGLTPLGVNVTGNIAITTALAIVTFLLTNFTGTKDYWKHIFDPLGDSMPWIAKIPLYIILIPIEVLGIFIKPFSLLIRLYANMQAGHIVLGSLLGLIYIFNNWYGGTLSFGLSFAISLIELLVAALQAYIFTMLSALYFGFASETHEHAEEHEGEIQHL